jgi:hypothetical protein
MSYFHQPLQGPVSSLITGSSSVTVTDVMRQEQATKTFPSYVISDVVTPYKGKGKKANFTIAFENDVKEATIQLDPSVMKDFTGKKCRLHLSSAGAMMNSVDFVGLLITTDLRSSNTSFFCTGGAVPIIKSPSVIGTLLFHSFLNDPVEQAVYRSYGTSSYDVDFANTFKIKIVYSTSADIGAVDFSCILNYEIESLE